MTNMNLKITKAIMISISKCVEKTTAKAYFNDIYFFLFINSTFVVSYNIRLKGSYT